MDVAALNAVNGPASPPVSEQVGMAVLKRSLEIAREQASLTLQLLQSAGEVTAPKPGDGWVGGSKADIYA